MVKLLKVCAHKAAPRALEKGNVTVIKRYQYSPMYKIKARLGLGGTWRKKGKTIVDSRCLIARSDNILGMIGTEVSQTGP